MVQVFASMQDHLKTEENDSDRMLQNIRDLATQLYQNVSRHCCLALLSVSMADGFLRLVKFHAALQKSENAAVFCSATEWASRHGIP